jgi:L-xylulokinase
LRPGIPVSAGVADNLGMAIALGILDERHLHMVSGTWGLNQLVTTAPGVPGDILAAMFGARKGETLLVEGGANSASGFEWLVNVIARQAPDREAAYAWCAAELEQVKDSDPPVYFLPYLNGRPDAAAARGGFVGLSSWHGAPHMIRAVFEGVAFEHRENVERLLAGRGNPQSVRFAGGAARSRPWLEIFAAVLNRPIELSPAKELGALGAAIVASVAVGLHRDLETAVSAMTRVKERIEPDPARVETMERRYRAFLKLRGALEPVWGQIAG